ncbi:MAG: hypothetical protein GY756_17430 [bacterium]|nr:hypothetical protein [bacterium]
MYFKSTSSFFYFRNKLFYKIIVSIIFLLVTAAAYIIRDYDYTRESAKYPAFVPFTLESAMMYSYSWDIAKNGYLKANDPSLVSIRNYSVDEQMSISLEYFIGYAFRIKNYLFNENFEYKIDSVYGVNSEFVSWTRIQIRLWISLTAGLIFIWLLLLRVPVFSSMLGGLLFAVSPAAIARATGQDLIRENFAIPLIILAIVIAYWFLAKPKYYKLFLFIISIFLALSSWDMVQLCLSIWALYEILRIFFGGYVNRKKLLLWCFLAIGAVLAGIINPYLLSHKFLLSPFMIIFLPSLLVMLMFYKKEEKYSKIIGVICLCLLGCFWYFGLQKMGFISNYSHFFALLKSKIYFNNVKPLNPKLLDFDSRILWTPALHSATFKIFWLLFHFIIPVGLLVFIYTLIRNKTRYTFFRKFPRLGLPFFFSIIFFILFIFMVRFHAMAIPFICVAIAIIFSDISSACSRLGKIIIYVLFVLLIVFEFSWFISLQRKYDDPWYEKLELIKELNSNDGVKGKTILADFTLSPSLKAYNKANIILQPKFELGETRDLVKQYLDTIYFENEYIFMKFCSRFDTDYFIFDKGLAAGGEKTNSMHPWSTRYVAGANELKKESAIYSFYYRPDKMKYFYQVDEKNISGNMQNRFTIFNVISDKDKYQSELLYNTAIKYYNKRNINLANKILKEGLVLNPRSIKLRYLFYQINHKWPKITINGVID